MPEPRIPSPLYARGYTVIPEPQQTELKAGDFPFGEGWQLLPGTGVKPDDVAFKFSKRICPRVMPSSSAPRPRAISIKGHSTGGRTGHG